MLYNDFLNAIIDDGIAEIEANYLRLDQRIKREGGVAGFNACRGIDMPDIVKLSVQAKSQTSRYLGQPPHANDILQCYWYWRYYELQVEWVLNVLSAYLVMDRKPPLSSITGKGYKKAMSILGLMEKA